MLEVCDGPEKLVWKATNRFRTVLVVYLPGRGYISSASLSGWSPPNDKEYKSFLMKAKAASQEKDAPVFTILKTLNTDNPELNESWVFAEYWKGTLEAYCRPPWVKGQELW